MPAIARRPAAVSRQRLYGALAGMISTQRAMSALPDSVEGSNPEVRPGEESHDPVL